jgi:hypothetical protein
MHHCLSDNYKHVLTTTHTSADCFLGNGYRTILVSAVTNTLAAVVWENRKQKVSRRCLLDRKTDGYTRPSGQEKWARIPCGGGIEYLHRSPASRRRQRKGKSRIWDNKIWSWVPRDSDLRKTTLVRASSIYKRQTRPLVREVAPEKQGRNCQRVITGAQHQDILNDFQSQCDFDFDLRNEQS